MWWRKQIAGNARERAVAATFGNAVGDQRAPFGRRRALVPLPLARSVILSSNQSGAAANALAQSTLHS